MDEVVDEVTQDVSYDLTLDRDFLRHGKLDCDVNIGRDECVKISRWERIHNARWQGTRLTSSPTHLLSLSLSHARASRYMLLSPFIYLCIMVLAIIVVGKCLSPLRLSRKGGAVPANSPCSNSALILLFTAKKSKGTSSSPPSGPLS